MLTSIIIPNYFRNRVGKVIKDSDEQLWFAKHCFDRLEKYTDDFELILIDNGCVHGQDVLKKYADVLITNKENIGFARSCNQGFREAKGHWIVCMNNDIFVWEGWLDALKRTFDDNKNCGVAMPALMKQAGNGIKALELDEIDLKTNFNKYGAGAEFGSCWLTKKSILDKVGLFDENFKVGFGEDRDMWRRMRMAGYETYRTHKTRVFHQGNVTMGGIEDRRKFTIPNRAYLKKIRAIEDSGKNLKDEEKKEIKKEIEMDYEENWDDKEYLKRKWGF